MSEILITDVKSGFFNSVNGDREYSSDDYGEFIACLINEGIFKTTEISENYPFHIELENENSTIYNMSITNGSAFILNRFVSFGGIDSFNIDYSDVWYDSWKSIRADAIVLDIDIYNERKTIVNYIKGNLLSDASIYKEPEYPELINTATRKQIAIGYIVIKNNGVSTAVTPTVTQNVGEESCPFVTLNAESFERE